MYQSPDIASLQQQLTDSQAIIAQWSAYATNLQTEKDTAVAELNQQIADLSAQVVAAQTQQNNQSQGSGSGELETWKKAFEDAQATGTQWQQYAESLQAQVTMLEADLNTVKAGGGHSTVMGVAHNGAGVDVATLSADKERLAGDVASLTEENAKLKIERDALQTDVSTQREDNARLTLTPVTLTLVKH